MNVGEEEKISIQEYLDMYKTQLPEFGKVDVNQGFLHGKIKVRANNCDDVWKADEKWPTKIQEE